MASAKFARLAAEVGSRRLAGWITNHNPKVRARADATRARKAARRHAAMRTKLARSRRGQ